MKNKTRYIVREDDDLARSVVRKLIMAEKEGSSVVLVTNEEYRCYIEDDRIKKLHIGAE